jgi:hypothetical protein
MAALIDALRSGRWLSRERVRLVAAAVLVASLAGLVWLAATSNGLNDSRGRPLGTDFSSFYAAGTYVLDGAPAAPFDPARQFAREQALFGTATQFYGWLYPPFFLGVAALLATMPYWLALLVWQASTLGLYLWAMRAILAPHRHAPASPFQGAGKHLWLLLALAFPAVVITLGHGQNAFLTAALFGAALALLDRRPVLAGILFGLIVYKPQFGLLIPLALVAAGRWRVFAAAAATVALLTLAVTLAFGVEIWPAFLASTRFARAALLETDAVGWYKVQSVLAWVRLWGGPMPLGYALQGAVALAAAIAIVWLWRGPAHQPLKSAGLLIGALLAAFHSHDYDLMLLAPALAFLAVDGIERGFAPWQTTLMAALWFMPLVARSLAHATLIPLAAPLMLAGFILVLRLAARPAAERMAAAPWPANTVSAPRADAG